MKKQFLVEFTANNSGGGWWLEDKDWKNLKKAGWKVIWSNESFDYNEKGNRKYDKNGYPKTKKGNEWADKDGRWLGALAQYAYKKTDSITETLKEFEKITKQDITAEGCNCCGAPFDFSWKDEKGEHQYCSGEDCLQYLYPDKKIPKSIRESLK